MIDAKACECGLMQRRQRVPLFWQAGRPYLTYQRVGLTTSKELRPVRSYVIAGLVLVWLATPALAAAQHYAVEDTVGNCSVIDARPSANLKIFDNKGGYNSVAAAQKALASGSGCKGMIDRA